MKLKVKLTVFDKEHVKYVNSKYTVVNMAAVCCR